MRYRVSVLALAILMLTACASGRLVTALPTPTNVDITPPAADLAPDLAAFSGTWEGTWDGQVPSRLIVERIDTTSARVVYIWGSSPSGYVDPGWRRYNARALPDGKIQWRDRTISFIFTMSKDRTRVLGERKVPGYINTTVMERVSSK